MDKHASEYFREFSDQGTRGNFHKVCALHDCPDVDWQDLSKRAPELPQGWYELSRLSQADRLEFIREYWLISLPYQPHIHEGLSRFFSGVDDVGIYLTQDRFDAPFDSLMVYSLKDDRGFFRGRPGARPATLDQIRPLFGEAVMPADYEAFLKIHNGFGKYTDTGITRVELMGEQYRAFQEFLQQNEPLLGSDGDPLDSKSLVPFYESFGLHCYQCFLSEWYPEEEMGNVYYSGIEKSLSNWTGKGTWSEKLAFPSFLEWLIFYLEGIA